MSSENKEIKQRRKTRRPPPPSTAPPPADLSQAHVERHVEEESKSPRPNNNREDSWVNPTHAQQPVQYHARHDHYRYPDRPHGQYPPYQNYPPDAMRQMPYERPPVGYHFRDAGYDRPYDRQYSQGGYDHPHSQGGYDHPPRDMSERPVSWNVDPGYRLQQRVQHIQQRGQPLPFDFDGNSSYPQPYDRPHGYPQRRAPPPQHNYPVENARHFQPYVDSDFIDPQPIRQRHEGEGLGENRPSTFNVSVTTLLNSTVNSISDENESMSTSSHHSPSGNNSISSDNKTADSTVDMQLENSTVESIKENITENEYNSIKNNGTSVKGKGLQERNPQKAPKKKPTSVKVSKSNKLVSAPNPSLSGYNKCMIMRDRKGMKNRLNPTYNLYSQDVAPGMPPKLIMIAQKQTGRTPNYRFFDMTKNHTTDKLDKHSRNYVGKLRGNFNRDEYTAYDTKKEVKCAVVYDKGDMLSQIREGALPRKMGVLLPFELMSALESKPAVDDDDEETKSDEEEVPLSPEERLATMVSHVESNMSIDDKAPVSNILTGKLGKKSIPKKYLQLASKEPVYEKQNYRLNFHGRVKLPSVKNYQLIQPSDIENVWTQFGKVTEDQFHLDYKEPLDTFTAFALAITQFDY